jgi:hypothetical protein
LRAQVVGSHVSLHPDAIDDRRPIQSLIGSQYPVKVHSLRIGEHRHHQCTVQKMFGDSIDWQDSLAASFL